MFFVFGPRISWRNKFNISLLETIYFKKLSTTVCFKCTWIENSFVSLFVTYVINSLRIKSSWKCYKVLFCPLKMRAFSPKKVSFKLKTAWFDKTRKLSYRNFHVSISSLGIHTKPAKNNITFSFKYTLRPSYFKISFWDDFNKVCSLNAAFFLNNSLFKRWLEFNKAFILLPVGVNTLATPLSAFSSIFKDCPIYPMNSDQN